MRPLQSPIGNRQSAIFAFTLLEVMLAVVILGTAMLVLMEGLTRSLNAVGSIRNLNTARELLQVKLAELDRLTEIDEVGVQEGDFYNEDEDENLHPDFTWTTEIEETELLDLYKARVTVNWIEQGQEVSESVETYLYRGTEFPRAFSDTTRRPATTPRR